MLLNCGVGEDSWESLGVQGDPRSPSWGKSVLSVHWKDWCRSWSSNTLATWCIKQTHWKRTWCWQRLKVGEEDDRGWNGWMPSSTQWTWVWVNSGSWWWTERPGVLQSMGSQTVGHDWVTELNWTVSKGQNWAQSWRCSGPWIYALQTAGHIFASSLLCNNMLLFSFQVWCIRCCKFGLFHSVLAVL